MKNKALKICLTGLALSVAGLGNAETTTLFTVDGDPKDLNGNGIIIKPAGSNLPFVSTGIEVSEGDIITIEVGLIDTISYRATHIINPIANADGNKTTPEPYPGVSTSSFLVPGTVKYSLVGYIGVDATDVSEGGILVTEGTLGSGAGFVGSDYSQDANASGYLYLAFNDDHYNDNDGSWSVTITTPGDPGPGPLTSCEAISGEAIAGGYISIAAASSVNGCLAAEGYVTIGANTTAHNIYAGAAVTIGALATAENIFSGAATTVGANATTQNIHAGAAITLGAHSDVDKIYAKAAITYGVGAYTSGNLDANANTTSTTPKDIHNATSMGAALTQISVARTALTALTPDFVLSTTTMGIVSLSPGVYLGGALNVTASSTITFDATGGTGSPNSSGGVDYVWVMNFGTLTVGASTHFITDGLGVNDTASIIWNLDTVTLGASTSFRGTAFVGGAFTAATSTVSCGNLYALGLISIGSIGVDRYGDEATCENQNSAAVFSYLDSIY